ncbi:binding-protein-dependent transport systems inner membrane component [Caballeronia arvi]|uniref:Binding-protein-dependent transport systems inner membrane component n=1 Tax=Caballeronia arvi TaxID=1777135 RepID=A0A158KQT6_9BURK|nr:ABC transporter permease [Caballeronia arvi]SAL83492.1 binding-protein-dependent transport systems inner membrane component [Caballeronia arvi]
MKIFGHKPTLSAWFGLTVMSIFIFASVLTPLLAPYGQSQNVGSTWNEPSMTMLLGADQIGRDMLTRIMYGSRMTIGVALAITLLSFFIGIVLGFIGAVRGGWVDLFFTRLVDVMLSIPNLIFALIILGVFGSSIPVLILTIAVLDSTRVFRLARALGMNLAVLEYVEAARLRGEGLWWIIRREILPNAWAPLVSEFGLRFCFNFLFIAGLSFLGLGIQPPYADLGGMVRENAAAINFGMMAPIYPAAAIALLTVSVNQVVDWMLSIDARPSGAQAEL